MDQQDIFRLLLIVLLLASKQLEGDADFSYASLNEMLILAMFTKLFCKDGDTPTPTNTTF